MGLRIDKTLFIEKAKEVHGDKYDYTDVIYNGVDKKVKITCPMHGSFTQSPKNHLLGHGCPLCRYIKTKEQLETLSNTFIKKAIELHSYSYDYSLVKYKNCKTKVCIICPIHGEFWQTPDNHLQGRGCPLCAKEVSKEKRRLNEKEVITSIKNIFGDKYLYDDIQYKNLDTKVKLTCIKHGVFYKTPFYLLRGCGCQKCKASKGENLVREMLNNCKIEFVEQARFDWLGKQSLDFFIPHKKIGIEVQGSQHFRPIEHFGGEREFIRIIDRDKRKELLCKENGIKLIYFTLDKSVRQDSIYSDLNELQNILTNFNE